MLFRSDLVSPTKMCEKCFAELEVVDTKIKFDDIEVRSLYLYNEKFKTMLYHLKGLGDIELAPLFLERQWLWLNVKYANYLLVPAPSSHESDAARGFNHVEVMFQSLGLKMLPLIYKTADFKQSDLHFDERQKVNDKLAIKDGERLSGWC